MSGTSDRELTKLAEEWFQKEGDFLGKNGRVIEAFKAGFLAGIEYQVDKQGPTITRHYQEPLPH